MSGVQRDGEVGANRKFGDVIVLPVCTSAVSEIDCGVILVERTLPVSIYSVQRRQIRMVRGCEKFIPAIA